MQHPVLLTINRQKEEEEDGGLSLKPTAVRSTANTGADIHMAYTDNPAQIYQQASVSLRSIKYIKIFQVEAASSLRWFPGPLFQNFQQFS